MPAGGTTIDIGAILTERQYLAAEDVERARALAASRSLSLTQTLLEEGTITRELLGQAVAEHLGVSFADVQNRIPTPEMVREIPEAVARQFTVVAFSEDDRQVVVATDERDKQGMTAALRTVFGSKKLIRAYALTEEIEALFVHYQKPLSGRLTDVAAQSDLPAPRLVDEIMRDALTLGASDIHIEPRTDALTVRFRIDGVLHEAVRLDSTLAASILNRIKVLAKLRLDDHFSAQDGAIRYALEHETLDVRVSVVPTVDGEKTVLRLLTGSMRGLGLSDLGLSSAHVTLLKEAAKKPFGMILTTGPTGSGKTTTLYAVLKAMNHSGINITTIEDPVEYRISGVNQIQVNTATGLSFADGLRAIVRQNPDAILVGEIRDHDTAEIAINSALTGHLLFSTFHANDAATAVPRLMEIGVEPFLASSTLELVIAQRLVRRICETCRTAVTLSPAQMKSILGPAAKRIGTKRLQLYRGKGCASCNNIGYRGRIGIFELLPISRAMRELILRRPSSQEIWKLARSEGVDGMFEDGMQKVTGGLTTLEELARVVNADEL